MDDAKSDKTKTDESVFENGKPSEEMNELINKVNDLIGLQLDSCTKTLDKDRLGMFKEFIDEYKNTQKETISTMKNLTSELNDQGKKEFMDYVNYPLLLKEISMAENLANKKMKDTDD